MFLILRFLFLSPYFCSFKLITEARQNSVEFVVERHVQIQRRNLLQQYEFLEGAASGDGRSNAIAYFSPSPAANPIPITEQNQIATSFAPQLTVCVLPPVAFVPYNETTNLNRTILINSTTKELTEPAFVASIPEADEVCSTFFKPSSTTICATILTGLATRATVTECDQEITFSSQWGFKLETPAPQISDLMNSSVATIFASPTIQTLITYYRSPWQSLTAGNVPKDVEVTICRMSPDGSREQCVEVRELWSVVPVIMTSTILSEVEFTTVITGPAKIRVETIEMDISKDILEISLSTTLLLEYEFESWKTESEVSPKATSVPAPVTSAAEASIMTATSDDGMENLNAGETVISNDEITTSTITRTRTATLTVENASMR